MMLLAMPQAGDSPSHGKHCVGLCCLEIACDVIETTYHLFTDGLVGGREEKVDLD